MLIDPVTRRSLLLAGFAETALAFQTQGTARHEVLPAPESQPPARHAIRFAVIGLDHSHIDSITDTIRRNGGQLVAVHSTNPRGLADFQKRFGAVRIAQTEDEILGDPSIQLICSAAVPNLRAPLGIRAMRHGKDFLSDKPAIVTLDQLADVRRAVQETKRTFAIFYGRMESRATLHAGALVRDGAIGRVIQTIQLAPHRVNEPTRPDWFWDPQLYGGTLCDLGSHQADEFVFFTGSTAA
ncbi:MAG: Gfo/Idh/MocA family oxidoreductase, partial [Acidobacteriota bacterium]|nr:Gfo/Idh/MocA family oxidoreductase [Acidobacteriota bacterium]